MDQTIGMGMGMGMNVRELAGTRFLRGKAHSGMDQPHGENQNKQKAN